MKSLCRFTREIYPWLPWEQIALLVFGVLIGLIVGYLIPPLQWWTLLLWGITGLRLGVLAAMFLMTRLSTSAMYTKIDGMPGATGHVISTAWDAGGRHPTPRSASTPRPRRPSIARSAAAASSSSARAHADA